MASYDFDCPSHGITTVSMPMAQVTSTLPCPACGQPARRVFSAPQLRFGDASARRLLLATEQSAHEPAVVSAPIGAPLTRRGRPVANPRTARLPKP
ncbi:FmdB family zinc ribbon protein [Nostocoides sp.]